MCVLANETAKRRRRLVAIGSGCLAMGLGLSNFVSRPGVHDGPWLHALVGFLLGVSVVMNLSAAVMARRCGDRQI
jgi:hypothetical protein